jgi:hypothetical protein
MQRRRQHLLDLSQTKPQLLVASAQASDLLDQTRDAAELGDRKLQVGLSGGRYRWGLLQSLPLG